MAPMTPVLYACAVAKVPEEVEKFEVVLGTTSTEVICGPGGRLLNSKACR